MSCIERAGWFSGLLSAVKLYQSVSISGPSATSKPIEAKIASMRSSARLTGWRPPWPRERPGNVTSSACAASCCSSCALGEIAARRAASAASIACLAALISAPRAFFSLGRQRAERLQLLGDDAGLAEIARLGILELGRRDARAKSARALSTTDARSFIVVRGRGRRTRRRGAARTHRAARARAQRQDRCGRTFSTIEPNAAGSLTAMSASTLRSMSIEAFFRPAMNLL